MLLRSYGVAIRRQCFSLLNSFSIRLRSRSYSLGALPVDLGQYARRGAPGAGETAGLGVHRRVVDFGGVTAAGLEKHSIPEVQCRHKTMSELSPENWSSIGVRILGKVNRCSD